MEKFIKFIKHGIIVFDILVDVRRGVISSLLKFTPSGFDFRYHIKVKSDIW